MRVIHNASTMAATASKPPVHKARRTCRRTSAFREAVAHAPHGEQIAGAGRVALELGPQAIDVRAHRVLIGVAAHSPHEVEQLRTTEGLARVTHQECE